MLNIINNIPKTELLPGETKNSCLRWLTTVLMEYKSTTFNSFEKGSKLFFFLHYLLFVQVFYHPM